MTLHGSAPKLVASDIDGTLINSADRVPQRLRDVISRMAHTDTVFALATGRPARWVTDILDQLSVRPICVCTNGAVLYDSGNDRILKAHMLEPEVLREVADKAHAVMESHGGVGIAVERAGVSAHDRIDDVFTVTPEFNHAWESIEHGVDTEENVLSVPAVKLLLRSELLGSKQMFDIIRPVIDPALAHVTFSMEGGLLEVAAPNVTKALGVADLADIHGVDAADVMCFGDMPNDLEMLQWAGRGIAVGNAAEELKAIADFVTGTNEDAGVADVLERWF